MTGAISRAGSGLRLAEAKVGAAAHNTANMLTPDAERMTATGVAEKSGVSVQLSSSPSPDADPVGDVLSLKQGATLYQANLQVIATEDRRLGQTVDLLG